jgi:hypothetical protein
VVSRVPLGVEAITIERSLSTLGPNHQITPDAWLLIAWRLWNAHFDADLPNVSKRTSAGALSNQILVGEVVYPIVFLSTPSPHVRVFGKQAKRTRDNSIDCVNHIGCHRIESASNSTACCRTMTLNEIDVDTVRKELDDSFAVKVLGLRREIIAAEGPLELLRLKLSREPSIRGAK